MGATRPVVFRARLLTATNKDLAAEVAAERFRTDLYYRLNVVSIHLPPLRDRREDIPELVSVLLAKHAMSQGKRVDGVDNATIRGLMAASWMGNVRELDNALERAVILSEGSILTPDDFPPGLIVEGELGEHGRQSAVGGPRLRATAHPPRPSRLRRRQARGRAPARAGPVVAVPKARRSGYQVGLSRLAQQRRSIPCGHPVIMDP